MTSRLFLVSGFVSRFLNLCMFFHIKCLCLSTGVFGFVCYSLFTSQAQAVCCDPLGEHNVVVKLKMQIKCIGQKPAPRANL